MGEYRKILGVALTKFIFFVKFKHISKMETIYERLQNSYLVFFSFL